MSPVLALEREIAKLRGEMAGLRAQQRRLLWCGDAGCSTGFARATHKTLDVLRETWDVHVLALNYNGDAHGYPYPLYPATNPLARGVPDYFGLRRMPELIAKLRPHVIVVQNDPWNIQQYLAKAGSVPVVGAIAVDGKNCRGAELNGLALAVFWTEFGMREANRGGYTGRATVIPLGVDTSIYRPLPKADVRADFKRRIFGPVFPSDGFIVGVVGRNQPRKRLDLTLEIFADWIKSQHVNDAYLMLHVAPTGEDGYDLDQLIGYHGVANRVMTVRTDLIFGVTEERMAETYNVFDVFLNTSQGEGWHLPTLEAMACGVPCVVPDWAALGEWPREAALLVPCTATAATPNRINVVGGVIDKGMAMDALHALYTSEQRRRLYSDAGLELAREPKFDWRNIGETFRDAIEVALSPMSETDAAAHAFAAGGVR